MNKRTTRRTFVKGGLAVAAVPLMAGRFATARRAAAAGHEGARFHDVRRRRQGRSRGEFLFYTHDSEPAIAGILEAFNKDFPKIKGKYVRAQNGTLFSRTVAERSAGPLRRRRHPVLRARDRARFPEARRLRALRLAAGRVLRARASEQSGRRLFLGRRHLRRPRLQHREGEARGRAEELEGHRSTRSG